MANFPVIQSSTKSKTNGASSHSVSLPASIVAGELLVMFFTCDSGSTITTPSGWTVQKDISNAQRRLATYTKVATGSEGATVTVTTSGTTDSVHASYRVATNVYTVTVSAGAIATDNTPDPDSLTNGASGKYLWFAVACSQTAATVFPTNYTTNTQTDTQDSFSIMVGTRSTESDTQDPGSFTTGGTSSNWVAYTVSLAPQTDVVGTHAILAMASTIFTTGISYGATGTHTLLTMASSIFSGTIAKITKSQWSNETKPTTNWDNES